MSLIEKFPIKKSHSFNVNGDSGEPFPRGTEIHLLPNKLYLVVDHNNNGLTLHWFGYKDLKKCGGKLPFSFKDAKGRRRTVIAKKHYEKFMEDFQKAFNEK
ncbi:MAG: hypothetical protein NTX91_00175 [candidate division SR1 bacterium]|nr:hypothetical protein [candidate division SR1 bacterium]